MEVLASLQCPQAGCSSSGYGAARTSFWSGERSGRVPSMLVIVRRSSPKSLRRGQVVLVSAKGRRNMMPGRTPPAAEPAMPKLDDDDNPKFVIFIRTVNVPRWYPLSIVSGGTTAKLMISAMSNNWGKKLYEGTLTRNIASVVYKDEKTVRQTAFKTYPVLKNASGFFYGYKVVDKKNPRSALTSSDVVQIPPEGELLSVVDRVKQGFANLASGVKDTFGSISPLTPEQESKQESDSAQTSKKSTKKKGK